tara:strand:+ start:4825 stop:6567 length:1743 start_codon:yes stop_codon:yes gene_type:complete
MLKNINRIFKVLKKNEIRSLSLIIILTVLVTFLEMISLGSIPIYVTFILDSEKLLNYISDFSYLRFLNEFSEKDILLFLSFTMILVFLFKNLFLGFFYYLNGVVLRRIHNRFSKGIYNNYLYTTYLFYTSKTSAELTRNMAEVTRFVALIGHYIRLLLEMLVLSFIILLTIKIDPIITIIALVIFGLFSLLYLIFIKGWLAKSGRDMQKFTKNQINVLNQTYSAIKEIKINLKENYLYELFSKITFRMNKIILYVDILRRIPRLMLEIIAIMFVVSISIYFIFYKSSNTELVSILSYIAVASIRLVPAFTNITSAASSIKYMEPSIDIVEKHINLVSNLKEENQKNLESLNIDKNKYNINNISVKNLSYNFNHQKKLITNLNLEIKQNEKIGIIGESGAGKSTFLNLLLGLIVPTKGNIKYNDKNIGSDKYFIYNFLGYVPQDTVLFNDTIKNNILLGDQNLNLDRLHTIIKDLELSELISSLPNGLETQLGERGINISGGQRQRIGLARALYKDPQVLFLDEATSSLDIESEKKILNNIFNYCKNKILILVSHRRETLQRCDNIMRLQNGSLEIIITDD